MFPSLQRPRRTTDRPLHAGERLGKVYRHPYDVLAMNVATGLGHVFPADHVIRDPVDQLFGGSRLRRWGSDPFCHTRVERLCEPPLEPRPGALSRAIFPYLRAPPAERRACALVTCRTTCQISPSDA